MVSAPTVSVVIATFNRASLVPRAIASVLRQTLQDFEIIIVNDASPDDTEEVVKSIRDKRIRHIKHEKNKGLPAGRNTGIRAAMGLYVAFLDDDDEWHADKLEKQVRYMQRYDAVLCGAEATSGRWATFHTKPVVELSDLRRGNQFPPSGLMARRSILIELPFDEALRLGEDWDAYIRIAKRYSIGFIEEPLLLYSDGDHDRMTNKAYDFSVEDLERRMGTIVKHKEFLGSFWFRHHVARILLMYYPYRTNKLAQLVYTLKRCGFIAVASVLIEKVSRRIRGMIVRFAHRGYTKTTGTLKF